MFVDDALVDPLDAEDPRSLRGLRATFAPRPIPRRFPIREIDKQDRLALAHQLHDRAADRGLKVIGVGTEGNSIVGLA